MTEKYLTQKNILEYFTNNPETKYMTVYISFVGNYTINGYYHNSTGFTVIEPIQILLERQKDEMSDCFGDANLTFNSIDPIMFPKYVPIDEDTLYPLSEGNITHFDWNVRCVDMDKESLDFSDEMMAKIKFYPNKKLADLNFVRMLRAYLDKSNLLQSLSKHDSILDNYSNIDPSDLMKYL